MNIADIITVIGFVVVAIVVLTLLGIGIYIYFVDRTQRQHPVLRNYPVIGRARYFFEKIGPELRQYFFNNDRESKPISREEYGHIVKKAKYKRDGEGVGSQREVEKAGYYSRNSMFAKLTEGWKMDKEAKVKADREYMIQGAVS